MEQLLEFLMQWGYVGLFIGAALPVSADLLLVGLLMVGANPVVCVLAASLGNWVGALAAYWLGMLGKWKWLEKFFRIRRASIEKYQERIEKYGAWLGLATGIPFAGDIVAVALGFFRIKLWKAAPFMLIGKSVRFIIITLLFLLASTTVR